MSKNLKKDAGRKKGKTSGPVFGGDGEGFTRSARIMAIVMVALMIAFTFLTAGLFIIS